MLFSRRTFLIASAMTACAGSMHAQQLAHAGWRGNSIATEAWWKHAVFVRFAADATFAQVSQSIDTMSDVSADSILLPDMAPVNDAPLPFDPRFGSEDDLDALLREASARRMHVLLRMPLARVATPRGAGEVRFWLSRGIAGFDVGTVGSGDMEAVRALRATLDHFPGQRILLARTLGSLGSTPPARGSAASRRDPVTLHVVSAADVESGAANTFHAAAQALEVTRGTGTTAVAMSDAAALLPGAVPSLRSLLPLLLSSGTPVVDGGLLSTPAERSAVQQVLTLRSTHAALRSGASTMLPLGVPGLRAWLLRDRSRSAKGALLLVTNSSENAITLHLSQALAAQGIRGAYLHALLRGDGGMGSVDLEQGVLPAGAALLGEIRTDSYIPATTLDSDAPPPGSAGRHRRR